MLIPGLLIIVPSSIPVNYSPEDNDTARLSDVYRQIRDRPPGWAVPLSATLLDDVEAAEEERKLDLGVLGRVRSVDRVSLDHHELAGRAKDLGSAAVMLSLVNVVVVWALVLLG